MVNYTDMIRSSPTLMLSIFYMVCCICCVICTGKKVFFTVGMFIVAALLTQYIVQGYITSFIGLKHIMYFIVLWALSVLVLQIDIFIDCYRIGPSTFKIAAINALGGSIASAIVVLVFDIVTNVIPQLKAVRLVLAIVPFIGPALSKMFDSVLLTHTNILFGMILARNIALNQACAPEPVVIPPDPAPAPAPAPPTPTTTETAK